MGHVDGSNNDDGTKLEIYFYNDQAADFVLHDEIKLSSDMPPRNITIDVSGLKSIKLCVAWTHYNSWYGIGNPILC